MALGCDIPRALGGTAGCQHPHFQNYIAGRLVGYFPSECVSSLHVTLLLPAEASSCAPNLPGVLLRGSGVRGESHSVPPAVPPDPSGQGTRRRWEDSWLAERLEP